MFPLTQRDPAEILAREIADLRKEVRSGSRGSQMRFRAIEGGGVPIYDSDGKLTGTIGHLPDGTTGLATLSGPRPGAPTAPILLPTLGGLEITWDGQLENGTSLPGDFHAVEVHASPYSVYEPDPTTLWAHFTAAGTMTLSLPPQPWTVMFVVRSKAGRASAPSLSATETPAYAPSGEDIEDLIARSEAALTAANGKNRNYYGPSNAPPTGVLATNDTWFKSDEGYTPYRWTGTEWLPARLGDDAISGLNVGKLVSGTVNATLLMGGRFATALSGARREMNSQGFQAWDAENNMTINLNGVSNLLTGQFRTALTGRRIQLGAMGAAGEINFIAPNNQRTFIKAYTEPGGVESIQLGVDLGGHYLFNRININSLAGTTYNAVSHEFQMGGRDATSGEFFVRQMSRTDTFEGSVVRFSVGWNGVYMARPGGTVFFDAMQNALDRRIRFMPGGPTGAGGLDILDHGNDITNSARLQLIQGDRGGVMVKSYGGWLEVRDLPDGTFQGIRSANFSVQSDEKWKSNIQDAAIDAVAVVKQLRVRQYNVQRPKPGGSRGQTEEVAEIGLVAQEAPDLVLTPQRASDGTLSVDLYQYLNLLALAHQEIVARVEALESPPSPSTRSRR